MAYEDHDFYLSSSSSSSEKKWKIFKKESSRSSPIGVDDASLMRSYSQKHSSSKSPPYFISRSYSQKPPSSSTNKKLSRCSSLKSSFPSSPTSSSSKNKSKLMRNFSKKSSAFGKKCTHLAKEQKARFYIMKRCVSMLVSWRKNGDS